MYMLPFEKDKTRTKDQQQLTEATASDAPYKRPNGSTHTELDANFSK